METIENIIKSHSTIFMMVFIILVQAISLVVMAYLIIKREKTLQLAQFAISPIGIKFIYEIDRDKKVELLLAENILLKKEVEVLKSDKSRLRLTTFWVILVVYFLFIFWRFKNLFSSKSQPSLPNPTDPELIAQSEKIAEQAKTVIK